MESEIVMSDKMREEFDALKFHERHSTNAETRYWCNQYKLFAEKLLKEQAARTVPDGFVVVPVELLQLIQCDVENSADWLSSATSALRNLLSAAPEGKK